MTESREIRLDLIIEGKKKTFTQDRVPFSKALDYTDQEAKLWTTNEDGISEPPSRRKLEEFRADFFAGLFDDSDLTGEVIIQNIDTLDHHFIFDTIKYRVLNYDRSEEGHVTIPKEE